MMIFVCAMRIFATGKGGAFGCKLYGRAICIFYGHHNHPAIEIIPRPEPGPVCHPAASFQPAL
jgi:hypothetical protein